MSDNTTPQDGTQQPSAVDPQPTQDAPKASKATGSQDDGKVFDEDYVKQLRDEAAKYRTERNDARQQLETIQDQLDKLQEGMKAQFEDSLNELKSRLDAADNRAREAELNAMRSTIAGEVGLPPQLAARLQGEDEESIRADAQALRETLPSGALNVRTGNASPPPQQSKGQQLFNKKRENGMHPFSPEFQRRG